MEQGKRWSQLDYRQCTTRKSCVKLYGMSVAPIIVKKVADLQKWDDNPRFITKEKYKALKAEIKKHGFKDVLKLAADGKTVLNGNHRLPILEELGIEEVNCIITDAKNPAEMLKVALSSNQDYAEYDRDALTELVYKSDIPIGELMSFEVDLGKRTPIIELLDEVGPTFIPDPEPETPQGRQLRTVTCPSCHEVFEV